MTVIAGKYPPGLIVIMLVLVAPSCCENRGITLGSLLLEMTDRQSLTRWSDSGYSLSRSAVMTEEQITTVMHGAVLNPSVTLSMHNPREKEIFIRG